MTLNGRFRDFAYFAHHQILSQDIDPLYPVLDHANRSRGLDAEQAAWLTILYVAYYHAPSALTVHAQVPEPGRVPTEYLHLPTGTERRGHRSPIALRNHLNAWVELAHAHGNLTAWLNQDFTANAEVNWSRLQARLRSVPGNGRWAAYKTGEVLMKVNGFPLAPTDMGNDFSTGPRDGLTLLFGNGPELRGNSPDTISILDDLGERLRQRLRDDGLNAGIEQVETILCDYHALATGRYYVGHDIDALQEQVAACPVIAVKLALNAARRAALPRPYLGECDEPPRKGVDRERKKHYQRSGIILTREP